MTKASFNMHVTNVHTNPLLCLVVNCSHKTPFGRLSDLRRHEQSAHSLERRFVCSVNSCEARIKEFARKDHLLKHMRERHDNYFCPMNHCFRSTKCSFVKPEDLAEHIDSMHGRWECALRSCAQMPLSKFSLTFLYDHLEDQHDMIYDSLDALRNTYQSSSTLTSLGSIFLTARHAQNGPYLTKQQA